ncbi:MAG TPA: hypothetical protein VK826_06995 [Bacteroidia bacterium]|nr:hypothetical protein [Bacteroidia bacterium]
MGNKATKEPVAPQKEPTEVQENPASETKEPGSKGNPENDKFQEEAATHLDSPADGGDCDYYIYQASDVNVFQVWKRFKDEGKITITWEEFQALNAGTVLTSVKPGDKLCFPKGTITKEPEKEEDKESGKTSFTVGGDPTGTRVIRVAWTIDDGPQTNTEAMHKTGLGGLLNTTWYVQRNRITEAKYPALKQKQDAGGEIAIHSFHKKLDHAGWFPLKEPYSGAMGVWPAGTTEDIIMAELVAFHKELKDHGINPKFVRLPTGLNTELYDYGRTLGLSDGKAKEIRTKIINGESIANDGTAAGIMLRDFNKVKDTLNSEDLILWGGASEAHTISPNSWQAEASGNYYRTDDVTKTVSSERAENKKDAPYDNPGAFERKVDKMIADNLNSTSLVVLAHDSTSQDVSAVAADKKKMEEYALSKKVKIEYHTMSSLFNNVTGENADKLDVNYPKN